MVLLEMFLYKLDPRTKMLIVLIFSILVFIIDKLPTVVIITSFCFFLRMTVKPRLNGLKYFKNLSMLVLFMILMQALLAPGENYIIKPLFPRSFPLLGGAGSLKWEGFKLGLLIACRLAALLFILPVFTLTTSPRKITAGLAGLGLNYRLSFVISSAFNLIPLFQEEARLIMDAQKLRGSRVFEGRSLFGKLKAYPGLAVPLVLGAMRKAQTAGLAMDSRAFGVYRTRTWLDKPSMKRRDFLSVVFSAVFCAAVLWYNFLY